MVSTSNKASLNLVNLLPLKFFHLLYNMTSTSLLCYGAALGRSCNVRDSKVQSEQKDNSFEDGGTRKRARVDEGNDDDDGCSLIGKDINTVMERLGIEKHGLFGEAEVQKRFRYDEISMFFEEEVKMEEVREAFDVFDKNKDGVIDAKELQRVLLALGLREGVELEACKRMLRMFDHNGDGNIDFHDFAKMFS